MSNNKKKIIGYAESDVGLLRKNNEDNFLLGHCFNELKTNRWDAYFCQDAEEWTCAAVFDGMGGIDGGEIASHLAAQIFQEHTMNIATMDRALIVEKMESLYRIANEAVVNERKDAMTCGTTASAIITDGDKFRVFHRGDSRVYLMRGDKMYILSKDQTLAQLKLDVGIYHSPEEVPEKEKHQLTEFIGMGLLEGAAKPYESDWIDWESGDKLLLCSDGLYDMCSDQEILEVLACESKNDNAVRTLKQRALENGGKDNVTILLLEIK